MDFDLQRQHKSAPSGPPDASAKRTLSGTGLDAVCDFFQGFMTGGVGGGAQNGPLSAARFNLPWASALAGGGMGPSPAGAPSSSPPDIFGFRGVLDGGVPPAPPMTGSSSHHSANGPRAAEPTSQPSDWPAEDHVPLSKTSADPPWNDTIGDEAELARKTEFWQQLGEEIREEPMVSGLDPRWGLEDDQPRGPGGGHGGMTPQRSQTPPRSPRNAEEGPRNGAVTTPDAYEADQDDLLDQHVAYYLRHHPDVHAKHLILRKRPGTYQIDDREIRVEWQYAPDPGGQGFLVALDGPLRQPFSDYMELSDNNAEWDASGGRSSLSMIPRDKRMSFHDQHKVYTRLEAMKVAKEQALVREKHADYVKDGKEAPSELMMMYKKSIQQKLGQPRRSQHSQHMPPPEPPAYPGDPAAAGGPGGPHGGPQGGHPGGHHGGHLPLTPPTPPPGAYPPWSGAPTGTSRQSPGLMPPNVYGPPGMGSGPVGGPGWPSHSGGPGYYSRWPG